MNRTEQLHEKRFSEEEWQKLFYKHQQQSRRRRLKAIQALQAGESRTAVMEKLGCSRQSLISWIDCYCQGGLEALVAPTTVTRKQRLSPSQKAALKQMLLEQKPSDYGIERQIWTGKTICEVIQQRWQVELKDSRIYDILKEIGLSYQKAHRDYENGDPVAQQQFVETLKKSARTEA
jgi:transposase